jgi:hypothetical protein
MQFITSIPKFKILHISTLNYASIKTNGDDHD